MFTPATAVRRALRHARRTLSTSLHDGRSAAALGALLLLGSTWNVTATANTPPVFTSVSLNATMIDEGQTVTLSGTFTDPDPGDAHTLQIYWHDNDPTNTKNQEVYLPAGQLSFSVQHTYSDDGGPPVQVNIFDRQHAPHANDNDGDPGGGWDMHILPTLQVKNVAPSFVKPSITVTKTGGKSGAVVVEGSFTDPVDPVTVRANWGDAVSPKGSKETTPCTVSQKFKTFRCEHTYNASSAATYQVRLTARDDDGGEDTATASVQIP